MSHNGVQQYKGVKRDAQLDYHEGKSPAAWIGSLTALAGFIVITLGIVAMDVNWTVMYLGCALIAIGAIATVVLKAMGYGTPPRDL